MFSRRSILALVNALNFRTHDEVERFSIEFELESVISGQWIKEKETSITKYLVENGNAKTQSGAPFVVDVVEYLLRDRSNCANTKALENALAKDGYELTESSVRKSLPSAIPLLESENKLVEILNRRGLTVAIGHYEQAIAAHGRGDWAAANAQMRSFVEEFFNQCHALLSAGSGTTTQQRKEDLARTGFFASQYNEFLNNGTGFVEGFWKRLHPQGSHPGLSESADSSFRLHLVLLVLHHYAERLDAQLA
ncbi:hypothetical protein [Pseudocolwellia agarivorans]|uniref:hypothetical protein n=1 Tax=Pseudocolwellia agarivorans TaxID=1911682 RepID=UPI000987C1BF|nr:hypothetical protein [Pseudocolwellia agarivorans]